MKPEWIQAIVAVISLVLTVVSVLFVWYQVRVVGRQLKIQNFSEYTKRYQQIILNFPDNVNDDAFDINNPDMVGDRNRFMRYMRAYCDMCFEEFWLRRSGLIDPDIWAIWEGGMGVAFARPAFRQAWEIIGNDSNFGPEFHRFIDGLAGVVTQPKPATSGTGQRHR